MGNCPQEETLEQRVNRKFPIKVSIGTALFLAVATPMFTSFTSFVSTHLFRSEKIGAGADFSNTVESVLYEKGLSCTISKAQITYEKVGLDKQVGSSSLGALPEKDDTVNSKSAAVSLSSIDPAGSYQFELIHEIMHDTKGDVVSPGNAFLAHSFANDYPAYLDIYLGSRYSALHGKLAVAVYGNADLSDYSARFEVQTSRDGKDFVDAWHVDDLTLTSDQIDLGAQSVNLSAANWVRFRLFKTCGADNRGLAVLLTDVSFVAG